MGDQTIIRRRPRMSKLSQQSLATNSSTWGTGDAERALQALDAAYARVAQVLYDRIDKSKADMDQISALGRRLGWISDRQRLVRTVLQSGSSSIRYVCADCGELDHIRSLAETAVELADSDGSFFAALGLLYYIDRELGWVPPTMTL